MISEIAVVAKKAIEIKEATDTKTIEQSESGKNVETDGMIVKEPDVREAQRMSLESLEEYNRRQEYDILNSANQEGLNDSQKETVERITGWSDEILDALGSADEASIYHNANLTESNINGKECLIRNDIDLNQKDEDGISNKERMERGRPPINKNGEEIELHHIGQKSASPLAELTTDEHRGKGNDTILHDKTKQSEIDRNEFANERRDYWKARLESMEKGN